MSGRPVVIAGALLAVLNLALVAGATAASCTVNASSLGFGSFSPLTLAAVDSTGGITVNCTDVSSYSISLSTGGSGTYNPRQMVAGGNFLDYNLYRDAAFLEIWGDGNSGSFTVSLSNPVNGQNNLHTLYGRIPLAGQRAAHPGTYGDNITVTVTY